MKKTGTEFYMKQIVDRDIFTPTNTVDSSKELLLKHFLDCVIILTLFLYLYFAKNKSIITTSCVFILVISTSYITAQQNILFLNSILHINSEHTLLSGVFYNSPDVKYT